MGDNEAGKSGSLLVKIVGAVFVAVIAPLVVGLVIWYVQQHGDKDKEEREQKKAEREHEEHEAKKKREAEELAEKKRLKEEKEPLTGDLIAPDLASFRSSAWSGDKKGGLVQHEQVDPAWFRYVKESPGPSPRPAIHVPGSERFGFLMTSKQVENCTLEVWWRWGEKTWRKNAPPERLRVAYILLHVVPGTERDAPPFPQSVMVDLRDNQGGTLKNRIGNVRLCGIEGRITCQARVKQPPRQLRPAYNPDGQLKDLASTGNKPKEARGWDGTIYRLGYYKEKPSDKPKDAAPWNKIKIDCADDKITVFVDGKKVNEIAKCSLKKGRIGFVSAQAEYYIGRIVVTPRR